MALKQQLSQQKMKEGESFTSFLTRFKEIQSNLAAIGVTHSDEDLCDLILHKLPSQYKPFVTTLRLTSSLVTPTFNNLCGQILQFEQSDIATDELETAFASKTSIHGRFDRGRHGRGRSRGGDGRGRSRGYDGRGRSPQFSPGRFSGRNNSFIKCFYCGKPGHYTTDCRHRQADINAGRVPPNVAGNFSEEIDNEEEETAFVSALTTHISSKKNKNDWYIDSGASRHMTPEARWFAKLSASHSAGAVEHINYYHMPMKIDRNVITEQIIDPH